MPFYLQAADTASLVPVVAAACRPSAILCSCGVCSLSSPCSPNSLLLLQLAVLGKWLQSWESLVKGNAWEGIQLIHSE